MVIFKERRTDMNHTAAVITISDKGARGERKDTSGPALSAMLQAAGFDVVYTGIIPDEKEQIKAELIACADVRGVALVLTTGGTGFSRRDNTPEATLAVIERNAPGRADCLARKFDPGRDNFRNRKTAGVFKGVGAEGVGRDDVGAGLRVPAVDVQHPVRTEDVPVFRNVSGFESAVLQHGAERTVKKSKSHFFVFRQSDTFIIR